ncbi:hypothetical protein EMIHUDRAFT_241415 [Emiliania huxleyi CCMP1516]|uniref:Uncharacterized protein n=2 Tax=Emiliania huxleyi TaxID=2903 RepID=A0A0D3JCQ4_EMIH1|nr:hypothetical protein EMIHUDRAFT_241415 [Emiliania huxleyi CCMP1516]EOD21289.1 hypothetical protein EMIHUDRAFT_241415 [Emiliania huxleyi CCMP1516]|eukprot:XP_005773718.1 hypothetical protein EMIHUDRAFT_241415 [Emiliania huxleyi CCMP1516]
MGSWQDFMNMGIHTGIAYAGAGADTATEWGNGKGDGAATANKHGHGLPLLHGPEFRLPKGGPGVPGVGRGHGQRAPATEGVKPRGGWMPFAQQGAATGAGFGAQGMDTAFRFFTDPNFDFQKEGQAYQASGAATGNAAPSRAAAGCRMDTAFRFFTDPNFDFQKEGQAYQASGAATGNAFGGFFAQQGASTGGGFMQQGAGTASAFMTDPNFDFQKEGEAYQESGKATQDKFGAIGQEEAGEGEAGYSFGAIGLVALFAVGAAVVGAIRARARSGPQYVRQTNPDELLALKALGFR